MGFFSVQRKGDCSGLRLDYNLLGHQFGAMRGPFAYVSCPLWNESASRGQSGQQQPDFNFSSHLHVYEIIDVGDHH